METGDRKPSMPMTERTAVGEQYVLPGAERRTAPGLPYAAEANGQLALHFYDPPRVDERDAEAKPALQRVLPDPTPITAGAFAGRVAFFPHVMSDAAEAFRDFAGVTAGRPE
jgi:hypothetical protein